MFDSTFTNVPKERIILAHEPKGKGHQKYTGWNEEVIILDLLHIFFAK